MDVSPDLRQEDTKFMPDRKQPLDFVRFLVFLVVMACAVFVPAGTLLWPAGWMFLVVISAALASVTFGIFRAAPDLLQERKTAAKRAKAWDKALVPVMSGLPLVGVVLAGLGKRFSWMAPFPAWCAWLAFVVMALGSALTYQSMRCNRFFSSHVRIQTDRGHHVICSGPYAHIRHPGYVGAFLVTLGTPVLLHSTPASVIALITAGATVLRTVLEDRTLKRELPGYDDYAKTVRYRLVPYVW
jgi:protein-S-isoprenylcysteine O-methyltransferase Ste14